MCAIQAHAKIDSNVYVPNNNTTRTYCTPHININSNEHEERNNNNYIFIIIEYLCHCNISLIIYILKRINIIFITIFIMVNLVCVFTMFHYFFLVPEVEDGTDPSE